jgi:hypothetical protein
LSPPCISPSIRPTGTFLTLTFFRTVPSSMGISSIPPARWMVMCNSRSFCRILWWREHLLLYSLEFPGTFAVCGDHWVFTAVFGHIVDVAERSPGCALVAERFIKYGQGENEWGDRGSTKMRTDKCFVACIYDRTQPIVGFCAEVCVGLAYHFPELKAPKPSIRGLVLREGIFQIDVKLREIAC